MDKQNIINDILQMSETNPSMMAQQQHRGISTGMGPTSESHTYLEKKCTRFCPSQYTTLYWIRKYYNHKGDVLNVSMICNCFIKWLNRCSTFGWNPCTSVFRLWGCPTWPASQGPASEERFSGHECVPSAALITVPHKGHKPIHCYAAATAARHGGKSRHDG